MAFHTIHRLHIKPVSLVATPLQLFKKLIEDGSTAYQCFYDLEKAFDSIEYSVTSTSLESMGIRSFYNNPCGQVRIGSQLSRAITLQHGVRQGSVLSPMLFLLVMDSLLKDLNEMAGISIEGIYAGSLCHAGDLRSDILQTCYL